MKAKNFQEKSNTPNKHIDNIIQIIIIELYIPILCTLAFDPNGLDNSKSL